MKGIKDLITYNLRASAFRTSINSDRPPEECEFELCQRWMKKMCWRRWWALSNSRVIGYSLPPVNCNASYNLSHHWREINGTRGRQWSNCGRHFKATESHLSRYRDKNQVFTLVHLERICRQWLDEPATHDSKNKNCIEYSDGGLGRGY